MRVALLAESSARSGIGEDVGSFQGRRFVFGDLGYIFLFFGCSTRDFGVVSV